MEAVVVERFGGPDALVQRVGERRPPQPGNVSIRVAAVGVNYYDTLVRSGAVSRDIPLPHVVGSDVVGGMDAVGPDVSGWTAGSRVLVAPGFPSDPREWEEEPENEAPSYFPTGT